MIPDVICSNQSSSELGISGKRTWELSPAFCQYACSKNAKMSCDGSRSACCIPHEKTAAHEKNICNNCKQCNCTLPVCKTKKRSFAPAKTNKPYALQSYVHVPCARERSSNPKTSILGIRGEDMILILPHSHRRNVRLLPAAPTSGRLRSTPELTAKATSRQ